MLDAIHLESFGQLSFHIPGLKIWQFDEEGSVTLYICRLLQLVIFLEKQSIRHAVSVCCDKMKGRFPWGDEIYE